ncbi:MULTISPECIES: DUF2470 domain-containing protein [unclassified Streptomyces]|uniref:DUF2470 domain-containing protein n=1 Tax=unclassified Streptomyces TaxID=2593676 RepID=UPI00278C14E7|nr:MULTISPECIES: DUF2470 domain-containing protein [unclassified Streptomyces]
MVNPVAHPELTPAERARTILAAADTLTLTTTDPRQRLDCVGLYAVDAAARLVLLDPADARLTAALATAPHSGLAAYAEFTDVAPVVVRDRVRARIALSGRLATAGPDTLVFRPARVAFSEDDTVRVLDMTELAAAAPDPLAGVEAELLSHLDTGHADLLVQLAELVGELDLSDVVDIRPVRLDRRGLVLRLEREWTHDDVRIDFHTHALGPHEVGHRIQELLDVAAARAHR